MNRCKIIEQSQKPANWLNPRRKFNAEKLIRFLKWHGRKILLDRARYADLSAEAGLDKYQSDQAADDLFALGLVEITMAGDVPIVHLLSADIDSAPAERPVFMLARGAR